MKITAKPVGYSSVVGRSVMLNDESGKCVAILAIVNPIVGTLDYKEAADEISKLICKAINNDTHNS